MGIQGLSYFIKSLPSLANKVEWKLDHDNDIVDRFIVDGNAFVYHIAYENRTNWTHGGQYAMIAQIVKDTVKVLNKGGIQATFLFDGYLPEDKIETRIKRHRSYIERSVTTFWNLKQINTSNKNAEQRHDGIQYYGDLFLIPPLTLEVVVQTLRELDGVKVHICEGEADGEVVDMAIKQNAYVVSQDSDMHVYPNVGKGYISLESLKVPIREDDKVISTSVFHPERLATTINIRPELLPLFGTLLGNDYLDSDLVRYPIGQWCSERGISMIKNQSGWPKLVAEFIRKNWANNQEVIQTIVDQLKPIISKSTMKAREEKASYFQDRIIESIGRYDPLSPLLPPCNKIEDHVSHTHGYSRQVMDVIKSKTFWTSIFIEDIEREFSWDVSRSLRQGLYGWACKDSDVVIEEYVREKQHLEAILVTGGVISNRQNNDQMEDFYQFHISNHLKHLSSVDTALHPLILCMRYMIYHCSKSIDNGRLCNHEVIGIIIATLRSLAPALGYKETSTTGVPALKKRSIHLSAQFQSIIYSSYLLSQILDVPNYLHQPDVLASMFNGLYFHYYIETARCGASIATMLSDVSPELVKIFCSVYRLIMLDLHDEVQDIYDYDIITSAVEEWTISDSKPKRLNALKKSDRPEKKKKSSNKSSQIKNNRGTNAFNVLSFGCNFDDE